MIFLRSLNVAIFLENVFRKLLLLENVFLPYLCFFCLKIRKVLKVGKFRKYEETENFEQKTLHFLKMYCYQNRRAENTPVVIGRLVCKSIIVPKISTHSSKIGILVLFRSLKKQKDTSDCVCRNMLFKVLVSNAKNFSSTDLLRFSNCLNFLHQRFV